MEVERRGYWPEVLTASWTALLPKIELPVHAKDLRPIRVLPTLFRLWSAQRLRHIMPHMQGIMPPSICAYLPGRDMKQRVANYADQLGERWRLGRATCGVSLDASKAFPSVRRSCLKQIALRAGVSPVLWRVLEEHYEVSTTSWRLSGQWVCQDSHRLRVGLSQGCPLSVALYNLAVLPLILMLQRLDLEIISFADDLTFFADDPVVLKEAVRVVEAYLAELGISLNAEKTQYFQFHTDAATFDFQGVVLTAVSVLRILGHEIRLPAAEEDENDTNDSMVDDLELYITRLLPLRLPIPCRPAVVALL
eukprot:3288733-Amphidinium_carterae.1